MPKYEKYAVAIIFLIFAATLSPWSFNFPLNDDWAYAIAARSLAETGRLSLCDWGSSTQVLHIITGAVCCKFFGFSFAMLRIANIFTAAGALFLFVKLLEEFEIGSFEKLAAGLTLALSPLFLVLANSFMTDVHYFFWMTASLYFYVRKLKAPEDASALLLAGACAAAAYLTRQLAAALPAAFTLTLLFQGRLKWRSLAAVWALPGAAILGYMLWFSKVHGPTWASENYVAAATLAHVSKPMAFMNDAFFRLFSSMIETGLMLLPLAAGYVFSLRRFSARNTLRRRLNPVWPWLALGTLAVFSLLNGPLPYLENTLARSGLGTLTLGGSALKLSGPFSSPLFWILATAAAAGAAVLLMCASSLTLKSGGPPLRFVFLACMMQLAVSLLGAKYFDRYLLSSLLPWFALAAVFSTKGIKFSKPAAGLALAFCGLLGWAGMKDYLSWNRAKWELAAKPRAEVSPDQIINGFDYEAWLSYEKNMAYLKTMKPLSMIKEWEWQEINTHKAIIAFKHDPKLKLLDSAEYSTPFSSRKGVLYLMSLKN